MVESPMVMFCISDKVHDGLEENLVYEDMSDFEFCFSRGQYFFNIETAFAFRDTDGDKKWIKYCFDCFTKWMQKHCYATDQKLSLYDVFVKGVNITNKFNSIEKAYAALKFLVSGYINNGNTDI